MSRDHFDGATATKRLILGCALTGAKFTPSNHRPTGDVVSDFIHSGGAIPCHLADVAREMRAVYDRGVRYIHLHARNPQSREQSCEPWIYKAYAELATRLTPDAALSFGASRNGKEIDDAIGNAGEWARVRHAGLLLRDGGAHFVTTQAAVELQIVRDMQRKGFISLDEANGTFAVLRDLSGYMAEEAVETVDLDVHSTAGGRNYGSSSAAVQLQLLQRVMSSRLPLGAAFEVEWVQHAASHFLTWYATHYMQPGIATAKRLNITLLFGFSPKLPFPTDYAAFRRVVNHARAIGTDKVRVSVTVGAAVLPHHAARHIGVLDVGPLRGQMAGPLERLVAYASQPDSGVDAVRTGLEDTPYILDEAGRVVAATNAMLVDKVLGYLAEHKVELVTDPQEIAAWRLPGKQE